MSSHALSSVILSIFFDSCRVQGDSAEVPLEAAVSCGLYSPFRPAGGVTSSICRTVALSPAALASVAPGSATLQKTALWPVTLSSSG